MQSLFLDPITRNPATPRSGFLRRLLGDRSVASIRACELDAVTRKDIGLADEQRTPDEIRNAWHLWMRVDDLRGL